MSIRHPAVDEVCRNWDKDVMFKSTWLGEVAVKNPCDAWIYQEIIFKQRPDVIIETGSFKGGGGLFLASICQLIGHGRVVSFDVREYNLKPTHPLITWVAASSTQKAVVDELKLSIRGKNVLVILDSNHDADHVAKELSIYHSLIPVGGYLIVEDTWWKPGSGGPWDAVQEFLKTHPEFEIDKSKEPYTFTNNPNGFLKRIK